MGDKGCSRLRSTLDAAVAFSTSALLASAALAAAAARAALAAAAVSAVFAAARSVARSASALPFSLCHRALSAWVGPVWGEGWGQG